ncbi:DcaP family trimeric outer membrane transporter [Persicobacter psychrovividus]|uniref:Porin n=1 Tax=Persicobacter psychrovividus TaxID=387638 RepID=A0ABN6LG25_9BACT|nr:porin [Persicobacter psychrovividus]BDD02118.1 porin [Persicobacter psychrovividus]
MSNIFKLALSLLLLFGLQQNVAAQNNFHNLRGSEEDSVMTTNFPGAWKLPGTDMYMKFGGYFRLDAIYDLTGAGSRNQLLMGQIPVHGTPAANAGPFFNMHLRETRFNFDIRRKTSLGKDLKFFMEFDFFDESLHAGVPRLRHAFVKYGNLLIGQTWTNLSDLRVFPFIMDFSAGDALFGGRSMQVRYEQNFYKTWQYGVALEMPSLGGIYNPYELAGETMPVMPLLSARITNNKKDGSMMMFGGQMQQVRWYGLKEGPNATAIGYGLVFNGRQMITDRLFGTWHAAYNKGLTNQILIFGGTDQGAVLNPDGTLDTEEAITLALGGGYKITQKVSANVAVAYLKRGELAEREEPTLNTGLMGHANLIWNIDKQTTTGVEYGWGNVANLDGAKGHASRWQVMIKYAF